VHFDTVESFYLSNWCTSLIMHSALHTHQ